MRDGGVAPDGSPVDIYRAIPLEPEFTPLLATIEGSDPVLDLGCGTGRLANHLARKGAEVTGVDESAEMLQHLAPRVEAVCGRIESLELNRRFEAVVLASHMVNVPEPDRRHRLLSAAERHLESGGTVYLERYDPTWILEIGARDFVVGPVRGRLEIQEVEGREFSARITYRLDDRAWHQEFRARLVDDRELEEALGRAGLTLRRTLDAAGRWIEATRPG